MIVWEGKWKEFLLGITPVADPGFSWGGANAQSGCANLFFAENSMKMKEFGPSWEGERVPCAPH